MRAFVFIASILLTTQVFAQSKGAISGRVTDDVGDPLPGANVAIEGSQLQAPTGDVTNAEGRYEVSGLPHGRYRITISYIGFKTESRSIQLDSEQFSHDVTLESELLEHDMLIVTVSRAKQKALDAPASVSVITGADINDVPALNVAENVRSQPGIDFAKTGLVQNNVVARGFNNVFSGALMTMIDNRISAVPSVRVNVNSFIPVTNQDVEQIEVVRGPGSALYGPNSANGVLHIITKSPIGSEGTTIGLGGGERSLRNVSFRHATSKNGKVGVKVSGQYYAGNDWEFVDSVEVADRGSNPRNYDLEKFSGEARLDLRPNDRTEIIFSAGLTRAQLIEMTGLGAAQANGWRYGFGQAKVRYQDWFAQVFYNRSDAGNDTHLLRTDTPIIDKSTLLVFQLQHGAQWGDRQSFTYGGDILRTRPRTEGTISGRHEDRDDINESGVYVQSETVVSDGVDLVLAGRYDDHNHIKDAVFSPRAALVLKPQEDQTFRVTYNRAFSTPTSNNLFLDVRNRIDAFGIGSSFEPALGYSPAIDVRVLGVLDGFTFERDSGGLPIYHSPFAPVAGLPTNTSIQLHDPVFTNVQWGVARGAVLNGFIPTFRPAAVGALTGQLIGAGVPAEAAAPQAEALTDALLAQFETFVPTQLGGLQNSLATLNLETAGFDPIAVSAAAVTDITGIDPTITETFEAGYKGVVNNNLILSLDVYRTKTKDFVGPLRIETPNVFLEPTSLSAALGAAFTAGLEDPENAQLAAALALLDSPGFGGNANGSSVDELVTLFVSGTANNGAAFIPFGTITPEQAEDPSAVTLTYRNFGQTTHWGIDAAFAYYASNGWRLDGNYSFVSDDLFENLDNIADIALNAPKHKFNVGVGYDHARSGFSFSGHLRYRDSFPMDSGVYVGTVESLTAVDATIQYRLPLTDPRFGATLTIGASNLFDNRVQEFIGAPAIGRLITSGVIINF